MAAGRRRIASGGARVGILASLLWSACGGDVGETVELRLDQGAPPGSSSSCGYHNSEQWTSTNPSVASVERDAGFSFVAHVSARAPGTFTVFVDFTAADDQRHRTTLAYCGSNEYFCSEPRKIGIVTVVP